MTLTSLGNNRDHSHSSGSVQPASGSPAVSLILKKTRSFASHGHPWFAFVTTAKDLSNGHWSPSAPSVLARRIPAFCATLTAYFITTYGTLIQDWPSRSVSPLNSLNESVLQLSTVTTDKLESWWEEIGPSSIGQKLRVSFVCSCAIC